MNLKMYLNLQQFCILITASATIILGQSSGLTLEVKNPLGNKFLELHWREGRDGEQQEQAQAEVSTVAVDSDLDVTTMIPNGYTEVYEDEVETTTTVVDSGAGAAGESSEAETESPLQEEDEQSFPLEPDIAVFNGSSSNPGTESRETELKLDPASGFQVVNSSIFGRAACRCGVSNSSTIRIVNGVPARITDLPWTVGLARAGKGFLGIGGIKKPFCGGTLINSRYVATASHCVDGTSAPQIKVLMNLQDDFTSTFNPASVFVMDVEEIKMHREYSSSTIDNDIALIRLAKPVPLGDPKSKIVPACIPANNENDYSGCTATAAGYGTIFSFGPQSVGLQTVDIPVLSNQICNSETNYKDKISDNMMCAGFLKEGGKDSCQGDSGGPLVINENERHTLVGIVSWANLHL